MAFRLGVTAQNAACNGTVQAVDGGTTNAQGRLLVYTGSQPATPATAATGTLLATLNLNNPSFGSSSASTSNLVTSPAVSAAAVVSGTPGWFRVVDRSGTNAIFDGSVTLTGSGGDLTFDSTTWVSGGIVTISSLSITYGM